MPEPVTHRARPGHGTRTARREQEAIFKGDQCRMAAARSSTGPLLGAGGRAPGSERPGRGSEGAAALPVVAVASRLARPCQEALYSVHVGCVQLKGKERPVVGDVGGVARAQDDRRHLRLLQHPARRDVGDRRAVLRGWQGRSGQGGGGGFLGRHVLAGAGHASRQSAMWRLRSARGPVLACLVRDGFECP